MKTCRLVTLGIIALFVICKASGVESDIESSRYGSELIFIEKLIKAYSDSNHGRMPSNWADVWQSGLVASNHAKMGRKTLIHTRYGFVDRVAGHFPTTDAGESIVVISRSSVDFSILNAEGNARVKVPHRLLIFTNAQGGMGYEKHPEDKTFRGVNLKELRLKAADLSEKQIQEAEQAMRDIGFDDVGIGNAFGRSEEGRSMMTSGGASADLGEGTTRPTERPTVLPLDSQVINGAAPSRLPWIVGSVFLFVTIIVVFCHRRRQ